MVWGRSSRPENASDDEEDAFDDVEDAGGRTDPVSAGTPPPRGGGGGRDDRGSGIRPRLCLRCPAAAPDPSPPPAPPGVPMAGPAGSMWAASGSGDASTYEFRMTGVRSEDGPR